MGIQNRMLLRVQEQQKQKSIDKGMPKFTTSKQELFPMGFDELQLDHKFAQL